MTTPANPASYDFVIIGAGEAGQAAAYLARARALDAPTDATALSC